MVIYSIIFQFSMWYTNFSTIAMYPFVWIYFNHLHFYNYKHWEASILRRIEFTLLGCRRWTFRWWSWSFSDWRRSKKCGIWWWSHDGGSWGGEPLSKASAVPPVNETRRWAWFGSKPLPFQGPHQIPCKPPSLLLSPEPP